MSDLAIATEIKRQLYAGGAVKVMSWGAHNFSGTKDSLMFRVQGFLFKGIVRITLTPMDVYKVTLIKMKKGEPVSVKLFVNVYCDQLTDLIDEHFARIPVY